MNPIMNFSSPGTALEWATIICKTRFCPKEFANRPEEALVAIAYGAELGLQPLQALQNIAVINGKPSIYGDAMLAVCKVCPDFEDVIETFDAATMTATCMAKRRNQHPVTAVFDKTKADTAQLWNKVGPWRNYPERMLQMRARGFALRDCFPDVLRGLIIREEAMDYPTLPEKDITPPALVQHDLYGKLIDLLNEKNIQPETGRKWLDKAGVEHFVDLPSDIMQKIINHLEKMEPVNVV